MCCCGRPTINGEPNAYSWDGKTFMTYTPNPPDTEDGDVLLFDEPGRCGGLDSHSHHFRVVKAHYGGFYLLVRHGGGDERIPLGYRSAIVDTVQTLALHNPKSSDRYWLLHAIYRLHQEAVATAEDQTDRKWRTAAAQKRIKTRKLPRRGIRVWIEPPHTPEQERTTPSNA